MDIENELLLYGVSGNHINKMKEEKIIWLSDMDEYFFLYYDHLHTKENKSIPVSKIGKTCRMNKHNTTWFDAIDYYNYKDGIDLAGVRIRVCLDFLCKDGLEETKRRYERYLLSDAICRYYDRDDVYFIRGDCNHRTITAKNINVENAVFKKVELLYFNIEKFNQTQALKKELNLFYDYVKCSIFIFDAEFNSTKYNSKYIKNYPLPPKYRMNSSEINLYINKVKDYIEYHRILEKRYFKFKWITKLPNFLHYKIAYLIFYKSNDENLGQMLLNDWTER